MISQRELERKYSALLNDVATKDYYKIDLTNRVNCYVCSCGHITKTKDVDAGITPMFFNCEKCSKSATSNFYRDIVPNQNPTIEWYRPTLKELMKKRVNEDFIDHVLRGGLNYRKINN